MMLFGWFTIFIYGLITVAAIIGIVYAIVNRVKESSEEDFEQRDN